jgi:hypothetical protein
MYCRRKVWNKKNINYPLYNRGVTRALHGKLRVCDRHMTCIGVLLVLCTRIWIYDALSESWNRSPWKIASKYVYTFPTPSSLRRHRAPTNEGMNSPLLDYKAKQIVVMTNVKSGVTKVFLTCNHSCCFPAVSLCPDNVISIYRSSSFLYSLKE